MASWQSGMQPPQHCSVPRKSQLIITKPESRTIFRSHYTVPIAIFIHLRRTDRPVCFSSSQLQSKCLSHREMPVPRPEPSSTDSCMELTIHLMEPPAHSQLHTQANHHLLNTAPSRRGISCFNTATKGHLSMYTSGDPCNVSLCEFQRNRGELRDYDSGGLLRWRGGVGKWSL